MVCLIDAGRQKRAILESAALTAAEALVLSSEYPSFIKIMKAVYVQRSGGYLVSQAPTCMTCNSIPFFQLLGYFFFVKKLMKCLLSCQ